MVEYLIDTQILIWSLIAPAKISSSVREILENNIIGVSQISLFEIAIKQRIGKLPDFNLSVDETIKYLEEANFKIITIKNSHIIAYDAIPLWSSHKDPFDRLILATALSENTPIISADENFKLYQEQIVLIEN